MIALVLCAVLAFPAVRLVGIVSGPTDAERQSYEAGLSMIDYRLAESARNNPLVLVEATQAYVEEIRLGLDTGLIGGTEASRKLSDQASFLRPFCYPCVEMLDRERDAIR